MIEAPEPILDFTTTKRLASYRIGACTTNLGCGSLNISASLAKNVAWLKSHRQARRVSFFIYRNRHIFHRTNSRVILARSFAPRCAPVSRLARWRMRDVVPKDKKRNRLPRKSPLVTRNSVRKPTVPRSRRRVGPEACALLPCKFEDFRSAFSSRVG